MTQFKKLAVRVAFALMSLLPFYLLSQGGSPNLPLSGVNGWRLGLVSPPPYDVFDTTWTGMEIQISDADPTDSVQLFRQYGDAHQFPPNEWVLQFAWYREPTQVFLAPNKILIDFRFVASQGLQGLQFGITLDDTSGSLGSEMTQKWVEMLPIWQILELDVNWSGSLEYIELIRIHFNLWAPDSMRVGLEILLNNMRFVYTNGDTIVRDNFGDDGPNSVINQVPGIPTGFVLHQNYPNPFNPTTVIRYEVPEASVVRLTVYDLLGQEIATLVDEELPAGVYETPFDGSRLSSGTYIYVLRIKDFVLTKKMILMK